MSRILKYYPDRITRWALKSGFIKSDWNGRSKVLMKQLSAPGEFDKGFRLFILLDKYWTTEAYRVEIWPRGFPNASITFKIKNLQEELIVGAVVLAERWFKLTYEKPN